MYRAFQVPTRIRWLESMSPNELIALRRRRPVIPFRLHVSGGVSYDITFPEWMLVGATTVFIGARRDPSSPIFDEPILVAVRHIIRAEPLEPVGTA